jgi:hypothetical protein
MVAIKEIRHGIPVSSVGDPDVLGLPDPDQLVRGTDPDPTPDPFHFP